MTLTAPPSRPTTGTTTPAGVTPIAGSGADGASVGTGLAVVVVTGGGASAGAVVATTVVDVVSVGAEVVVVVWATLAEPWAHAAVTVSASRRTLSRRTPPRLGGQSPFTTSAM